MWCLTIQDVSAKTLDILPAQTLIVDQFWCCQYLCNHVSLWQLVMEKRFDPKLNNAHFRATLTHMLIRLQVSQAPLKSGKARTSVCRAADPHLWKWLFISGPLICASRCQTAQRTQRVLNGSERRRGRRTVSLLYTGRTESSLTSMNEFFCEGTFHAHFEKLFHWAWAPYSCRIHSNATFKNFCKRTWYYAKLAY